MEPQIFDAQIKITRHIAKVLYSVMLQGRGISIISKVKCSNNNNTYYNIYVCINDKKNVVGSEIKYTAGQ